MLTKERFYIFEGTYAIQEKEREDNLPLHSINIFLAPYPQCCYYSHL